MYNVDSEAYQVTSAIFGAFYRKVLEDGALPIIVVYPDLNDHGRSRKGRTRRYAPLLDEFRRRGYRTIDLLDAFEPENDRYTIGDLTRAWGHYSPLGNRLVARYILDRLNDWGFADRETVEAAKRRELQSQGLRRSDRSGRGHAAPKRDRGAVSSQPRPAPAARSG